MACGEDPPSCQARGMCDTTRMVLRATRRRKDGKEPATREGQASVRSLLAAVPGATLASVSACFCCPSIVPDTLMKGGHGF